LNRRWPPREQQLVERVWVPIDMGDDVGDSRVVVVRKLEQKVRERPF